MPLSTVDENVTDCEIDDPELTSSKKHLMQRATPLSLVDILRNKYKHFNIIETMRDDNRPNPMFVVTITLKNPPEGCRPLQGVSYEPNKQRARHMAAQSFLKAMYPSSATYTWTKVVQLITTHKDPFIFVT